MPFDCLFAQPYQDNTLRIVNTNKQAVYNCDRLWPMNNDSICLNEEDSKIEDERSCCMLYSQKDQNKGSTENRTQVTGIRTRCDNQLNYGAFPSTRSRFAIQEPVYFCFHISLAQDLFMCDCWYHLSFVNQQSTTDNRQLSTDNNTQTTTKRKIIASSVLKWTKEFLESIFEYEKEEIRMLHYYYCGMEDTCRRPSGNNLFLLRSEWCYVTSLQQLFLQKCCSQGTE